jgi:hypothetical protein
MTLPELISCTMLLVIISQASNNGKRVDISLVRRPEGVTRPAALAGAAAALASSLKRSCDEIGVFHVQGFAWCFTLFAPKSPMSKVIEAQVAQLQNLRKAHDTTTVKNTCKSATYLVKCSLKVRTYSKAGAGVSAETRGTMARLS